MAKTDRPAGTNFAEIQAADERAVCLWPLLERCNSGQVAPELGSNHHRQERVV